MEMMKNLDYMQVGSALLGGAVGYVLAKRYGQGKLGAATPWVGFLASAVVVYYGYGVVVKK
jgi:hypothetical protein